jgi:hypothetical protein
MLWAVFFSANLLSAVFKVNTSSKSVLNGNGKKKDWEWVNQSGTTIK